MTITVMIATRNRRDDLVNTCRRLSAMDPRPDEVLVCADGCTDGTGGLIREQFPDFVLLENIQPLGSVGSRDLLLRTAKSDIVVSLDDDSYPVDDDFFARLPQVFDQHPEAAVVCFPELRNGGLFGDGTQTASSPGRYVPSYANCAAAMRRDCYLENPGFPPFFFHMYEEPDYALQCYAAGRAVWFEPSLVVRHHFSMTGRVNLRQHKQQSRNELWSAWMRCPWPWLPVISAFRIVRQFQYAWSQGPSWVVREPQWWYEALRGMGHCLRARRAVKWRVYYGWMRLSRLPQSSLGQLTFLQTKSTPGKQAPRSARTTTP